ncbi:YnfU family zinc-binding protein [Klebsiella oxytoca]|uniref:YnfU family zinc-binding protein n=1 Tax=Klebsiella oxytoca TaxID=571 RepID=UPI003315119A
MVTLWGNYEGISQCPVCAHRADQKAGKLRKDAVLECPACGLLFRPSECWCIGG